METNIEIERKKINWQPVSLNLADYGYRIVQIEVTNRCNMRCSFCPLPIRETRFRDMPVEDVFQILVRLSAVKGIDFVAFHQFGEPMLYPHIWECIAKCKELGLSSQLITNGLTLTVDNVQQLIQNPPDILRISLQTLDPSTFNRIRGVKVDFSEYRQRVISCLSTLIREDCGIKEIRTDLAVAEDRFSGIFRKSRKWLQKAGVFEAGDPTMCQETPRSIKKYLISFLKDLETITPGFIFSLQHLEECMERYYTQGPSSGFETAYMFSEKNFMTYKLFWNGRKITEYYPVQTGLCATNILGILADGTVTPCCLDYNGCNKLGNVYQSDLGEIFHQNRRVIDGLHKTGELHFEACKRCLGARSKLGAEILNLRNPVKILLNKLNLIRF